jgi:hypothetical protein
MHDTGYENYKLKHKNTFRVKKMNMAPQKKSQKYYKFHIMRAIYAKKNLLMYKFSKNEQSSTKKESDKSKVSRRPKHSIKRPVSMRYTHS